METMPDQFEINVLTVNGDIFMKFAFGEVAPSSSANVRPKQE